MNVGILGAGAIAFRMAETLSKMNGVKCLAVGARDLQRAEEFANLHKIPRAYSSYEVLCEDPDIDLIYIATPHSHHFQHAKLALSHKKHVLCEKAFTSNAAEAKELLRIAKENHLLITEAMWPRYVPLRKTLESLVSKNVIGNITSMTASLCYPISHVPRLNDPKLAGGALLDLGVYVISLTEYLFGLNAKVQSTCVKTESGVDKRCSISLTYHDGKIVRLFCDMTCVADNDAYIYGETGYLHVRNVNNYEYINHCDHNNRIIKTYYAPTQITGFEYQIEACSNAIRAKQIECEEIPHHSILSVMEMMDALRTEWGIRYPSDILY